MVLQVKGNILFQSNRKVSAFKVSLIGSAIMQVVQKKRKRKEETSLRWPIYFMGVKLK